MNFNLYESKRHFTQKFSEALNRKGIETRIIDTQERPLGAEDLNAIRRFGPDLTCSFNTLLPLSDKRFLWDFLKVPHLAALVDPALYSVNLTSSPYSIISCVDRSDSNALLSQGFQNTFFWPHAVEKELCEEVISQDRPYEVVFFGSCYDFESLRASWRMRNTEIINKVLDDAIDIVLSDSKESLAEALVTAWNASKLEPSSTDFLALFYYLDNYTRGKDRYELIRSIKDAKVHIFGELSTDSAVNVLGWPQYLAGQSNVTLHPSVPYEEALQIMKKSKICLNSMPFFKNGTHERVFAGLACGALPVTSESTFLREQFKEGEEILYYTPKQWNDVNGKINTWLRDEKKRREAVVRGRQIVAREHTWDKRTEQLLKELPAIFERIHAVTS